jgi:hypothetical protein
MSSFGRRRPEPQIVRQVGERAVQSPRPQELPYGILDRRLNVHQFCVQFFVPAGSAGSGSGARTRRSPARTL